MPTYDYECTACGHRFEELQSFSDPVLTKCPKCKKKKLNRLFGGGGAILFKGSGFYETDYRRAGETNGDGKPEKGDKSDKGDKADKVDKVESKDAAKTETPAAETKAGTKTETKTESKPAAKSEGKGGGGKKAK